MKKFVIIDGNAIVHRAYHALPPMTVKGTMINAVYGFASMLLKVIKDLKPDYLAVSFDVKGPTFRDKLYEAYKAKRIKADQELYDQIPLCYEVVKAFDIPIYTKKGFEADDIIATVVAKIRKPKSEIRNIIVTGDMDMLQMVDDNTEVYAMRKGLSDLVMFNEKEVKNKYGFGPKQIVDYKALRGDASDNIPGVPGIGEKTATELIQKIGGVDEIYKKIKKIKDYKISDSIIKKLEDGEKKAKMSKELAAVDRNVPDLDFKLEDCEFKNLNTEKISGLFKKFEFWSLLKRIQGIKNPPSPPFIKGGNKGGIFPLNKGGQRGMLVEIDDKNIKQLITEIEKAGEFACKEIINGADILNGELVGLVVATEKNSYHILNKYLTNIKQILNNNRITLIGHDLKQLVKSIAKLEIGNWKLEIFDVMIDDMKLVILSC